MEWKIKKVLHAKKIEINVKKLGKDHLGNKKVNDKKKIQSQLFVVRFDSVSGLDRELGGVYGSIKHWCGTAWWYVLRLMWQPKALTHGQINFKLQVNFGISDFLKIIILLLLLKRIKGQN